MAGTLNVTMSVTLQVFDTTAPGNNQCIVNRPYAFANANAAVNSFESNLVVPTSPGVNLVLPAATIWMASVVNKGSNNIQLTFTATGNPPAIAPLILPGGIWSYFQPTETAGGITVMTLTAISGPSLAEVLLAA
jgi:hypothetical protein